MKSSNLLKQMSCGFGFIASMQFRVLETASKSSVLRNSLIISSISLCAFFKLESFAMAMSDFAWIARNKEVISAGLLFS